MINNKPHKIEMMVFLIAAVIAGIGVYFLGASITGFVIKEFSYSRDLSLVVTSNGNYTLELGNIGELKSLKLDGRVTSYGKARVYIESNGIRHLAFDSTRLNETDAGPGGSNIITGFAISEDKEKKDKNNKPVWVGENEFVVNGTAEINLSKYFIDEDNDELAYSASEAEGLDASIDGSIAAIEALIEEEFNTTITFIASDGIDSKSHTVKLAVIAEKIEDIILPINETNETINQTPAINETIPINQTINETINATLPINETNQTINQTPIINETKTISINLSYNSGTVYDSNDNGEESVNGVVDLSVAGSKFGWNADESKLCTRWEVYNAEDGILTKFCSGNADCCAFFELLPAKQAWDDAYYSTYGKDGAGHDNIVSAQVLYYDVNLSIPKSEIYNSGWGNLSVKFYNDETEFFDKCIDTCYLSGLNKSSYTLIFEIEDGATLRIDKLKYSVAVDIQNSPPAFVQNISRVNVSMNKNITISLLRYFNDTDGDILDYNYYKADNIAIVFENDTATIIPDKNFEGIRYTFITANDSEFTAVSDVFMINASREALKPRIEIGKPVKWTSTIVVDAKNTTSVNLSLPEKASNVTITILNQTLQQALPDEKIKVIEDGRTKDKGLFEAEKSLEKINRKIAILEEARQKDALSVEVDNRKFDLKDIDSKLNDLYAKKSQLELQLSQLPSGNSITGNVAGNLITGNAIALTDTTINSARLTLFINESLAQNTEITVEYETEAPMAIENEINEYTKQVKVVSETSYEDVLSYTTLNDVPKDSIKLYWVKDTGKELFNDVDYYDENLNGLIDRIEWTIPHLSNQTFEVTITILNVQSYPTVFGNWTVAFNTTGTGNLSIYGYGGTSYAEVPDDSSTVNDLEYLETRCNNVVLNTTIVCANGEEMPYEVYKIKKRIAEIKKRLNELNQSG